MPPACLVVLLLLTACARRPDGDPDIGAYHAVSLDGSEVSLRDLRGQVVLLNVWTLWCLPCRSEGRDRGVAPAAMAELPCARTLVLDAPTRLGRALDALSPR